MNKTIPMESTARIEDQFIVSSQTISTSLLHLHFRVFRFQLKLSFLNSPLAVKRGAESDTVLIVRKRVQVY